MTSSSTAMSAATQALRDADWSPKTYEEEVETGVLFGSGIGGLGGIYDASVTLHERGPRRISPFFIPGRLINLAERPGFDRPQAQRPQSRGRHRLLDRRACDRRRRAADRAWRRQCDGRRRRRIGGQPPVARGFLRLPRPVDQLQRSAEAGLAALRPRPRRFRHGRRRWLRRARGSRARQGARRAYLRRADRLRPVGRRLSHHLARARRRRRLSRHERGARSAPSSRRPRSTMSTRTARRRRSATRSNCTRSSACSATRPPRRRCPRPSPRSAISWARRARSRRSSPSWPSATRSRRRPSISTTPRSRPRSISRRMSPRKRPIHAALSNSFGFGGTNASLVFRAPN